MTTPPLPEQIELHRDRMWRRDEDLRIESAVDAERFIEDVGFANTLTDTRRAGPSLYIAVCGRRDVSLPRNVQKDEETGLTWRLKDEVMRRGRVYYAKLAGGRSMFVAPRLISHFAAIWMPRRKDEPGVLSTAAQRVLKVLRRERELATADLRVSSRVTERAAFTRALDELQRQMKVIPQDVIYQPTFSYIWMLAEDRWPEELRNRGNVSRASAVAARRKTALREIARAYLAGAGMSVLGETARASGLSRVEAGSGNHQLVDEGYAVRLRQGIYTLAEVRGQRSKVINPTNGSWWMVQIQPTSRRSLRSYKNPINGSWWMVQIQPCIVKDPSHILLSMFLTPFKALNWVYQLHYYLCFRTHRRRTLFASKANQLPEIVAEICAQHDYHLLECQPHPDQLRCLVSLPPNQAISKVMQTIKTNSSRESSRQFSLEKPVWARGFLAKSVGRMHIDTVQAYLEQQAKHHGYDFRRLPPVYRYRASPPVGLTAAHAKFELTHQLVIATRHRKGIFGSALGRALNNYWLSVAAKRDFAIDQISVVPDHVHLLVRIVPRMDIEECALLLMNNGQHFIGKNYPQVLIKAGVNQLWEASAYAGTCGKLTTALLKSWLSSP